MLRKQINSKMIAVLAVLLVLFTAVGAAEEERTDADGQWKYVLEDGGATITGYVVEPAGDVVIPGALDGYPVTGIRYEVFPECKDITVVIIPEGVTEIGSFAFYACKGMFSVTLPDSITSIGDYAFADCSGLTSVSIPAGVTDLGGNPFLHPNPFQGCLLTEFGVSPGNPAFAQIDGVLFDKQGKTMIAYPNGRAGEYAIPDGVTHIGDEAFGACAGLTAVTIPAGVIDIGRNPFQGCPMTQINVAAGNPVYEQVNGVLFDQKQKSLIAYPHAREENLYAIPEGTLRIGESAFSDNGNLTGVIIPGSVTHIGDSAFWRCAGLRVVTISDGVTHIGDMAFEGCENLIRCTVPDSVTRIGESAFWACDQLTSMTIPSSVTDIGVDAFRFCKNLVLTVEEGSYAEQYAEKNGVPYTYAVAEEEGIDASGQWKYILEGGGAAITGYLGECDGDLLIPDELGGHPVTAIGDEAFNSGFNGGNGYYFTSVTIPAGVTRIGDRAFECCAGLTAVTFPESLTSIGDWAFHGCAGLTGITIPEGVTSINYNAFSSCSGLTSVTLPETLTSIEAWAFSHCVSLTEVTLPDSVASIENFAFENCESLTRVTLPGGLTTIEDYAFASCPSLTDIIIPDSIADILKEGIFTGEPPPG